MNCIYLLMYLDLFPDSEYMYIGVKSGNTALNTQTLSVFPYKTNPGSLVLPGHFATEPVS